MILRNKKTGEVVDFKIIADYDDCTSGWRLEKQNGSVLFYDHIDEIKEEWEDYKPAEPLIKDEKIRKAVRAWAEAIGATKDIVFDGSKKIYAFYHEREGFEKLLIYGDNDLEELKRYTIIELCGEEEE